MKFQYLVDTDWVIHYLNGHQTIVKRLSELQQEGVGFSIMSLAELYEGVHYSRDPEKNESSLKNFLCGVTTLGIDEEICKIFGKERGRLRAASMMIGDIDVFIAATALRHGVTLLTNNRRHFERVNELKIESI